MRMWSMNPLYMCRKHLIAQHCEIHMFLGSIKKGISIKGYIDKNLIQPKILKSVHDETVKEMLRRGYKHKTEITQEYFNECFNKLPIEHQNYKMDTSLSLKDLIERCPECKNTFERFYEIKEFK